MEMLYVLMAFRRTIKNKRKKIGELKRRKERKQKCRENKKSTNKGRKGTGRRLLKAKR